MSDDKALKPWEKFGLTRSTYYYQMKQGKIAAEHRYHRGRYSGQVYDNSKERLSAIRDKYKNGIPEGTIEAMLGIESGG